MVPFGVAASSVYMTLRNWLSQVPFMHGKVWVIRFTGHPFNGVYCYGTDVYWYNHPYLGHCAVHAGVIGIGQVANLVGMWVDLKGGKVVGSTRNSITTYVTTGVRQAFTFLSANSTQLGDTFADFNTHRCAYGYFKPSSGNVPCKPWTSYAGCPAGTGFVEGNTTHDSACVSCATGFYSADTSREACAAYEQCPSLRSVYSPIQTHNFSQIGQLFSLEAGPGYTRNSSVMLWCYPDRTWRSLVVLGTPAVGVDTYPYARPYLGHFGFKAGNVFRLALTGVVYNGYPCYGTDVYSYFYHWVAPCAVHAGVLWVSQKSDVGVMWVDPRPNRFIGTKRNGVQSHSYPTYPYAYTFLSGNSTTYGAEYADFKETECAYGYWKNAAGNLPTARCIPWSSFNGCPVGQGFTAGNTTHDSRCEECTTGYYSMYVGRSQCVPFPQCPTFSSIENVISTPTDLTTLGFHPYGWTCATFKSYKWCENGAPTSRYSTGYWPMKNLLSPDGYDALQACVACGGGGNGSHVTTFSASFGLVAQLHTGPGYSRNSSVLLWCYPDLNHGSLLL